jgi:uncharacterized membrane protein
MKRNLVMRLAAAIFVAMLAVPFQLTAQSKQNQPQGHHHYQLVDLGSTLGGPQSYLTPGSGLDFAQHLALLNAEGVVAGYGDTANPDPFPNYCFSSDCLATNTFVSNRSGGLIDLGALPGGGDSAPNWITANGLVAGLSENGETDPLYPGLPQLRGVLWINGKAIDLKTLPGGGYQSEANSVNLFGQVVGAALNTVPDNNSMQAGTWLLFGGDGGISPPYAYQTRAFIWDEEHGMRDMGTLGGTDAEAFFINDRGQVVGASYTGSTPSAACSYPLATDSFIWEREKGMVELGGFGGTCTVPAGLNQLGQIVGSSNLQGDQFSQAFLWEQGKLHHLGGSLGGGFTGAFALNEIGQTVGFGTLAGDAIFHAALWKRIGDITDLGVIGDDQCSYAADINIEKQVVGSSIPNCADDSTSFRAALWEDGASFDLNNLIPAGSPLYLQYVETINDRGEIAGQGVDSSGNEHAFLLIPCDDNHPGVEGCDYGMAGPGANAETIPAPGAGSVPSARPALRLPSPLRKIIRGVQPSSSTQVISDLSAEGDGRSSSTVADGRQADFLHDSADTQFRGYGNCLVDSHTDKLTGTCRAGTAWVCWSGRSNNCPSGAKAIKPEKSGCGLSGSVTIDADRACRF